MARALIYVAVLACGIWIFGFRSYTTGTDTLAYHGYFSNLSAMSYGQVFANEDYSDALFYLLSKALVDAGGIRFTFAFYAILLVVSVLYACRAVAGRSEIFPLVLYATLPSVYALGTNIMRSGVAISALLIATIFILRRSLLLASILIVIATTLHASSVIYIFAWLLATRSRTSMAFAVFFGCTAVSILGFGARDIFSIFGFDVLASINLERSYAYFQGGFDYKVGFRWDFWLYSIVPVFALLGIGGGGSHGGKQDQCSFLLRCYLFLCSAFVLSFHYPYSDRVGVLAWMLAPLLVAASTQRNESGTGLRKLVRIAAIVSFFISNIYLLLRAQLVDLVS